MSTYEQRELAGVSLINQPMLPSESKHTLNDRKDEAKLQRIEAKELREFNQPMVEFNYHKELTDTLENPYDKVKNQLIKWNYTTISEDEALHVPYKRAA